MKRFLGFDTSNYTTSCAVCSDDRIDFEKQLLPVRSGQLGLRQSDAVFHHIRNLPDVAMRILKENEELTAVGVSDRPRDQEDSYMPCFAVGVSSGRLIAASRNIPIYRFSHQAGHIVSALYSAKRLDILNDRFIAFHVSGGTTEAVLVTPDREKIISAEIIASSLDLKAGQAIDRCGVMLGLPFPAGAQLEKLSEKWNGKIVYKPSMQGADCSMSGIENKVKKMLDDGHEKEEIAFFCIEAVRLTLAKMCDALKEKYGDLPLVFSGGVCSNKTIRSYFESEYNACLGEAAYSSDNAVGIAVLAEIAYERGIKSWKE